MDPGRQSTLTIRPCCLTTLRFSNKLRAMSISLDSLEGRIDQLLSRSGSLRAENEDLRSRVAALEAEKAALKKKIDATAARLENLMEHLPVE